VNWYVIIAIAAGLWFAKTRADKVGKVREFRRPDVSEASYPGIQVTTVYSNGKSQTTEEIVS